MTEGSTSILASELKKQGHEAHLIFFKNEARSSTSVDGKDCYTIYTRGSVFVSALDADKPSDREIAFLRELIRKISPDVLGVSTRSFALDLSLRINSILKKDIPSVLTIAGGYGPSLEPHAFLRGFDYICFGEGDRTVVEMGRLIDRGRAHEIRDLPNIGYLDENGELKINIPETPILCLEDTEFPDWSDTNHYFIDQDRLIENERELRNTNIYDVFVGRGCYSTCSYCMSGQWNKLYKDFGNVQFPKVRLRKPENVIEELVLAKKRDDVRFVRFMDPTFPAQDAWVDELLASYTERIGLPFFCNVDPRFHKTQLLEKMARAGLKITVLGIQSGSERIRETVLNRRGCDNERLIETAQWLDDNGIEFKYDLLGFNPFDSEETSNETFELLSRMPTGRDLVVFKLRFFPKSPLGEVYARERPSGLSRESHLAWIYLWHLAVKSNESRRIAREIKETTPGRSPVEQLRELEKLYRQYCSELSPQESGEYKFLTTAVKKDDAESAVRERQLSLR